MPTEAEFIQSALAQYREALDALPSQFQVLHRQCDRQIDLLCEEAGIMGEIQGLRDSLTASQKKLQTQADLRQGQISALALVFDKYHFAPIPEGVTHLYGIELEPLDGETRLRVMHGNMPGQEEAPGWRDTILTLGGDPEARDWDGTYEEEEDDEEDEDNDIISAIFAPQEESAPALEELLEEAPPAESAISQIADEISRIEEKLEEGAASDDDLLRVNELTSQLQAVLGE